MTAKAALIKFLLEGRVLSLKNCFNEIGLSNPGREIPRMVERPFGVVISRVSKDGKNRYGNPVTYTEYRLNRIQANSEGISKMMEYCMKQANAHPSRTEKEVKEQKILDQIQLF